MYCFYKLIINLILTDLNDQIEIICNLTISLPLAVQRRQVSWLMLGGCSASDLTHSHHQRITGTQLPSIENIYLSTAWVGKETSSRLFPTLTMDVKPSANHNPFILICFYVYFVFYGPQVLKNKWLRESPDQPTPEKNMEEELHRDLEEIMADLEEMQVFCIKLSM